jgi:signal transduction histidine kinase
MVGTRSRSVVPPTRDISSRAGSPARGTSSQPTDGTLSDIVNAAREAWKPWIDRRRPHLRADLAIALGSFGVTIALLAQGLGSSGTVAHRLDPIGIAIAACASLPLIVWRRSPLGVFTFTTAASASLMVRGYPAGPPIGPTIALYLLAASRDASSPWTRRTTAVVIGMFCLHIAAFGIGHGQLPEIQLAVGALAWSLAWFAGERTRLRRAHLDELEQRAIRAERDAVQDRRLAIAEERARIARDLHDSAAHAINVIAIQAGAARLWQHQDPPRSRAALETIEMVARRTVAEIDQIVHSLREGGAPGEGGTPGLNGAPGSNGSSGQSGAPGLNGAPGGHIEPPPGLAALDSLLAQHGSAGLPVSVDTVGAHRPLAGAVDRAAYRILQEALTNSARHGDGGADVRLAFGERALELTVSNAMRKDGVVRSNGGHGLVGMRERASLLGGELDAGPADGDFRVHARLPYGQAT